MGEWDGAGVVEGKAKTGLKPRIFLGPVLSGLKPGPISEATATAEAEA
jgi:hypothetical protein